MYDGVCSGEPRTVCELVGTVQSPNNRVLETHRSCESRTKRTSTPWCWVTGLARHPLQRLELELAAVTPRQVDDAAPSLNYATEFSTQVLTYVPPATAFRKRGSNVRRRAKTLSLSRVAICPPARVSRRFRRRVVCFSLSLSQKRERGVVTRVHAQNGKSDPRNLKPYLSLL